MTVNRISLSGNNLLKEMARYNEGRFISDAATLNLCSFIAENIHSVPLKALNDSQRDIAKRFKDNLPGTVQDTAIHIQYTVSLLFSCFFEFTLNRQISLQEGFIKLDLADLHDFTDEDLINLVKTSPNLREIDLSYTRVTNRGIQELVERCPYLEKIILTGTLDVGDESVITIAQTCRDLTEIGLDFVSITNESLRMLGQCPKLKKIEAGWTQVTDVGLQHIADGCSLLEVIKVSETTLGDEGITAVARKCHWITELDLRGTKATNESLKAISECPFLRNLDVCGCKEMTDEGLKFIETGCLLLEEINCAGTKITNEALWDFASSSTQLKRIRRYNHEMTKELREQFRSAYPNIEIFTW